MIKELVNVPQLLMFVSELTLVHSYDMRPYIWDTNSTVDALIDTLLSRTQRRLKGSSC